MVYGRAGTDGSTLHANITSGATSMSVDTTSASSPLWTTAGGDFPFDIAMAGERITVTNITGVELAADLHDHPQRERRRQGADRRDSHRPVYPADREPVR